MALVEEMSVQDAGSKRRGDVVLGDDWVAPDGTVEQELQDSRARRGGLFSLRSSPLTRKIITFNLIALNVLVGGILYLNSSRDGLVAQRAAGLVAEAELIADVFEAQLPTGARSLANPATVQASSSVEQWVAQRQSEEPKPASGGVNPGWPARTAAQACSRRRDPAAHQLPSSATCGRRWSTCQ